MLHSDWEDELNKIMAGGGNYTLFLLFLVQGG